MRKRDMLEVKVDILQGCSDVLKRLCYRILEENDQLKERLKEATRENDSLRECIEKAHSEVKKLKTSLKIAESEVFRLNGLVDEDNRQQAEIERLQTENRILSQKRVNLFERLEIIEKAKAEAIKEFAERLKMANTSKLTWFNEDFDTLVKEMVGDVE